MSVDRRLREGLARIASEVDAEPVPALLVVQGRARRRNRAVRSVQVLAVVAVTVLTVLGAPSLVDRIRGAGEPAAVQPAGPLAGTYVVDVADTATNRRAGMPGRWVVTLQPDEVVDLTAPKGFARTRFRSNYRIQGDTLRTNALLDFPGCQAAGGYVGTYRWLLDGTSLRFVLVQDSCPARVALFTGQAWQVAS